MEKKKSNKLLKPKSPTRNVSTDQLNQRKVQLLVDTKNDTLKVSQDFLSVTGSKGYRTITANYPVIEGTYFFEVKIERSSSNAPFPGVLPQIRVGIATIQFDKEISLGSDQHSYAYKSVDGNKIHNGIRTRYGSPYSEGDIIGCLVHMKPPKPKVKNQDSSKIQINEGSYIEFFKNKESQGRAFVDLNEGFYFASVSLYMNARVRTNFGPEFETLEIKNTSQEEIKPYSEIANEPKIYEDIELPQICLQVYIF